MIKLTYKECGKKGEVVHLHVVPAEHMVIKSFSVNFTLAGETKPLEYWRNENPVFLGHYYGADSTFPNGRSMDPSQGIHCRFLNEKNYYGYVKVMWKKLEGWVPMVFDFVLLEDGLVEIVIEAEKEVQS